MKGATPGQTRLGWLLVSPAAALMLLVAGYPIAYAAWLSLLRYDLRFPDQRSFLGLANYLDVLRSSLWWNDLWTTLVITVVSVSCELILGMILALVMHRTLVARPAVRAVTLIPYGIVTVVSALAWRFAFDPVTGFVNPWLGIELSWLSHRATALVVIVAAEVWKTTPFLALLLLAGLSMVPEDLLQAARIDGAGALQRFFRITLPLMQPVLLVALLFRTLDAFRIFDAVFVMTRGAAGTETVSILGYRQLLSRLNLGIGSAVSILIFLCVGGIAVLYIRASGTSLAGGRRGLG